LQRVGGEVVTDHAVERIRIASCSPQRLQPEIVTHANLPDGRYDTPSQRPGDLEISLQSGQDVFEDGLFSGGVDSRESAQ
jgi:hypothetical protein